MKWALQKAFGNIRGVQPKKVHITGTSQLGFPFMLGRYFNRNSSIDLFCYGPGGPFDNQGQIRHMPLNGGDPHCQTPDKRIPALKDGEKYPEISLFLGSGNYVSDVLEYLKEHPECGPLVWYGSSRFSDNEQVMKYIANVVSLLLRLKEEHQTRKVYFFCGLPFHVLPLLGANLLHVMDNVIFMEFLRDLVGSGGCIGDMYEALSDE